MLMSSIESCSRSQKPARSCAVGLGLAFTFRFSLQRPLNCSNFCEIRSWALPTALRIVPNTSSERLLSLVSCSICWHQPSMRPVSACSSFRNQFPSLRHAGVLECTPSPWELQFPDSRLGSGGGREEGSKAGSRVSGGELDILDGADVCLRWCCSMALSCPLVVELLRIWLLVQLVAFSVGVASNDWDSTSVFCLEAMLLSRLRGLPFSTWTPMDWNFKGADRDKGSSLGTGRRQSTWIPIEESFLLGTVGGCSRVAPVFTVSFWDWVDVEVVVVATALEERSRGAGTGGPEPAARAGLTMETSGFGGWILFNRLPVRMLQRLSDELLRPDWLLTSLVRSCWSRYVSWADSVLLCNVTEMSGLDADRGGTGGGAFLLLTFCW